MLQGIRKWDEGKNAAKCHSGDNAPILHVVDFVVFFWTALSTLSDVILGR
jgi:hypothetical protein